MTRDDIDPQKPLVKLLLVSRSNWTHPNGTAISEGDRDGYRAVMKTGETRVFMSLMPGEGPNSTRRLLDIVARRVCQDGARDNVKEMIGPWRE
jgi:hypothetical protein